jgi:hypothetical protein
MDMRKTLSLCLNSLARLGSFERRIALLGAVLQILGLAFVIWSQWLDKDAQANTTVAIQNPTITLERLAENLDKNPATTELDLTTSSQQPVSGPQSDPSGQARTYVKAMTRRSAEHRDMSARNKALEIVPHPAWSVSGAVSSVSPSRACANNIKESVACITTVHEVCCCQAVQDAAPLMSLPAFNGDESSHLQQDMAGSMCLYSHENQFIATCPGTN